MIDRQGVYNKFGGRCAYCGETVEFKKFQVDHMHPRYLAAFDPRLENDRFDNLMPACRKCNIHKGGMALEMWRGELSLQVTRLLKNSQFNRALRYGQIKITETPIVFYFEGV